MRANLFAILIVLVFTLAASSQDWKPCSLLTAAEIHEAMGITVDPGMEDNMDGIIQCSWAAKEDVNLSLVLSIQKAGSNAQADCSARWKGEKDTGRRVEDGTGLGDKCWWSFQKKDESLSIVAMTVCNSKGILRISVWGSEQEPKMKEMSRTLAQKALSRF